MELPWFSWRGRHSRDLRVTVSAYPPVTRAPLRDRRARLPGRSGSLTPAGEPCYDDMTLRMEILLMPGTRPADVTGWLSGSGELILGCDPERALTARMARPLLLEALPGGWHRGEAWFTCDPLKARFPREGDLRIPAAGLADGAEIVNPGDVIARPLYRLEGSGMLTLRWGEGADAPRLTVDLTAADGEAPGGFLFDSDTLRVTTPDGAESLDGAARLENGEAADFGLPPGASRLWAESEGGTVGPLTLTPRWRWL